jgi:hypothetical protein
MRPAPPQPYGGGPAQVAPPQKAAPPQVRQPTPQPPEAQQQPPAAAAPSRRTRTIRRAKLRLVRVDPWSVTKVSFLLSIAFGIMCVVAVFLVFSIMHASGLWDHVNTTVLEIIGDDNEFDIHDYVGMRRVMGITMLVAAVDVVLITALATLGAFIYNMAASLLGGVEVTLAEDIK